jgi:hypothetical protein
MLQGSLVVLLVMVQASNYLVVLVVEQEDLQTHLLSQVLEDLLIKAVLVVAVVLEIMQDLQGIPVVLADQKQETAEEAALLEVLDLTERQAVL